MTIYAHRIIGSGSGGEQFNTGLHSSLVGSLATAANAWQLFGYQLSVSAMAALWDPNMTITELVTDELHPTTGKSVGQQRQAVVYPGTSIGVPLSPRDALVLSLRTATPGPGGRGRMYFPAPTSLSIDATGKLTSGATTAISAAFATLFATLASVTQPVVYHRPTVDRTTYDRRTGVATVHPASVATAIPIHSLLVGRNLGTQRRRTNKTANAYLSAGI
jgi:hypothetical protein